MRSADGPTSSASSPTAKRMRRYLGLDLLKQCRAALDNQTPTDREDPITIVSAISA